MQTAVAVNCLRTPAHCGDGGTLVIRPFAEKPSFPLSIVTRTNTITPKASSLIQKMINASLDMTPQAAPGE